MTLDTLKGFRLPVPGEPDPIVEDPFRLKITIESLQEVFFGVFSDVGARVAKRSPHLQPDGSFVTTLIFTPDLDAMPYAGANAGPLIDAPRDAGELVFDDATRAGRIDAQVRVEMLPNRGP